MTQKSDKVKEQFEIEHLDPDQRSWYYDGDGTKKQKEPEDERQEISTGNSD